MGHEPSHDHGSGDTSTARFLGTMALNLLITGAEVAGGVVSGSLSLISDALHNLSDGVSVLVSYLALRLARRRKTERFTFGLKRAQILAAALNASVLIAVCGYLFYEAYGRFVHPQPVATGWMIGVAVLGLSANVAGTLLLRQGAKGSLNVRSSYLHLLSDVYSSLAVIFGGVAMRVWGAYWLDPLLTVAIGLYVLKESFDILREVASVLLLCVPGHFSLPKIRQSLQELPGVRDLHHVHLWCVDDRDTHFEAHVEVEDMPVSRTEPLLDAIEQCLRDRFGINHVTLQLEVDRCTHKALV